MANLGFFLNNQLGVACNPGRKIGGQADGFVKRIGMQRLGAAQSCRQTFQCGSDNIVIGVLGRQAPARSLAMRAQHG